MVLRAARWLTGKAVTQSPFIRVADSLTFAEGQIPPELKTTAHSFIICSSCSFSWNLPVLSSEAVLVCFFCCFFLLF